MARDCTRPPTGLTPICDLGQATYQGFVGGLYPNGVNFVPPAHKAAGAAIAAAIQPINGKVVLAGVGFSVSNLIFEQMQAQLAANPNVNPALTTINLCKAGIDAADVADPSHGYWIHYVPTQLANAGLGAGDVQAIWLLSGQQLQGTFPTIAQQLQATWRTMLETLKAKFPNAVLCFNTTDPYHGYSDQNYEPWVYEQGFALKWVLEEQIYGAALNYDPVAGPVTAPWCAWADYPWADGINARADGLDWICPDDVDYLGVHPSATGAEKLATRQVNALFHNSACWPWLIAAPSQGTPQPPGPTGALDG